MKNMENIESLKNVYENYLKEKEELENLISDCESNIVKSESQLYYYKNNYNELRMFSPRQNLKSKEDFIEENTNKLNLLKGELNSYKAKLKEVNSNIGVINSVKEKMEFQPGKEVLTMNENDRKRIARDLHDFAIQDLVYLIHKVEIASKFIDQDPIRAKLELSTITKGLKDVIQNMRNLVFDLHPMTFDDLGFESTLTNFFDNISVTSELDVSYECDVNFDNYDDLILINLFRIIQECCNNTIKHSKGKKLNIKMYEENKNLILIIQDDGVGFQQLDSEYDESKHFGIKIIKDRISLLSGKCEFSSSDKGVKVWIKIPAIIS